jgi:hypothetical protein
MQDSRWGTNCVCDVQNMTEEELLEVQSKCYAHKLSDRGFLKADEKLKEVLEKDAKWLSDNKLTTKQLSDRLIWLIERARRKKDVAGASLVEEKKSLEAAMSKDVVRAAAKQWSISLQENGVLLDNKWLVASERYSGAQICPFQPNSNKCYFGYKYGSEDFLIYNLLSGEVIVVNTLLPHMIQQHGFFEGSVKHRVGPQEIARVCEIQPSVDYTPQWKKAYKWRLKSSVPSAYSPELNSAQQNPDLFSVHKTDGKAVIYCSQELDLLSKHLPDLEGERIIVLTPKNYKEPKKTVFFGAELSPWGSDRAIVFVFVTSLYIEC